MKPDKEKKQTVSIVNERRHEKYINKWSTIKKDIEWANTEEGKAYYKSLLKR